MKNNSLKLLLIFVLFLSHSQIALSEGKKNSSDGVQQQNQNIEVTGTVTDKSGTPLVGVTVHFKDTKIGTFTDADGKYVIKGNVNPGIVLVFSYIGYDTEEAAVGNRGVINVQMTELINDLDEVIVTGYASQAKREITGAISAIKPAELGASVSSSIDAAMQGRMSGVNIQSSIGIPGAGITVRVRGVGSISAGNDPIYVLDGVVFNSQETSHTISTNALSVINPEDILSIEVLKDAAAASVYGAQAANGVILITTKRGRAGKTNVNFSYRLGQVSPVKMLDVLNSQDFLNARFEAVRNRRAPGWTEQRIREEVLRLSGLPLNMTDEEIAALPTYDWQGASYRTGTSHKYDLSVDGGSEKSQYRIAFGYEDTDGPIIASNFKRGSANMNYTNQLTDKISLTSVVNLSTVKQAGPLGSQGTSTQFSAPAYASPMILPHIPIYLENGELNVDYSGFPGTFKRNVIHSSLLNEHTEKSNSLLANMKLNYQILDNLSYRLVFGLDYRDQDSRTFYDPRTSDGYSSKGILKEWEENPVSFTNTHVVTYDAKLNGEHKLKSLAGVEYYSYSRESASRSGQGFPTFQFRTMQSAALITEASGSWTGYKRLGSFIQANYTYGKKFMLSGILRYDGSSRFGEDNKFGLFPAISAGWDIAEEEFMNDIRWVNQLKLRVGYGETGNDQIGNFASRSLYGGGASYDGEPGIASNSLGNSSLRWERNSTSNLGVDFSLLNHKLSGAIEVYKRKSKDLLLSKPVIWAGGYSSITQNLGELSNSGFEFEINARIVDREDFEWHSSFNITLQKNEVTKLYDGHTVLPGNESIRVGYSLQTHVYTQYAGVNPATGKAFWYDASGNPTYTPSAMKGEDYAPYGLPNGMPKCFGGFNNKFSYKGLTLDIFFQYDYGRVLYDNMTRNLSRKGDGNFNTLQWFYDNRWTEVGQITSVPRSFDGAAEVGSSRGDINSSRYLQDASYIRLKNISLSYDIPKRYLKGLNISYATLKFQASNIFTITKFTGHDPEYNSANTGVIPLMKSVNMGISIGF